VPNAPVYVLLGSIASGKTVQAKLLEAKFAATNFSVGSLIRDQLADDERMQQGQLLPDGEVNKIVIEAVSAVGDDTPIIFDGFPRIASQQQWLDEYLQTIGREVTAVIYIVVSETEVDRRLHLRQRHDDTPEAIAQRKQVFNDHTLPVIAAYRKQQKLITIESGDGSPAEVSAQIIQAIEART